MHVFDNTLQMPVPEICRVQTWLAVNLAPADGQASMVPGHQQTQCLLLSWKFPKMQCFRLMIAQSPLVTKHWAGPVKFDPGQVKIITREISEHFWATERKY